MRWVAIIGFLMATLAIAGRAQAQQTNTHFYDSARFIYGIDNRRTHIGQQRTLIYGAYVGVGIGSRLRFKVGINGTPFERGRFVDNNGYTDRNRLLFLSIGEEYDFFVRAKLRITTYLQAGTGFNYFRAVDTAGNEVRRGRDQIIPMELGLHGSYPLVPWARLKIGGGWRFVLPNVSYDLSGYYLKLGVGIDLKGFRKMWMTRKKGR